MTVTNEQREAVIALARKAAGEILAVYDSASFESDAAIEHKDDRSPLTAADLASHRCIVAGLRALTPEQEAGYRQLIEAYRVLEASPEEPDREMRLLELDNAFHRRAFELCGMEHHFDHMLASLQHVERIRKFSLQTEENKSVCSSHTAILEALLHGSADDVSEALESHLSRYKQSVAQARSVHPEYFIDE